MKKVLYYIIATILFLVEIPFLILTSILVCCTFCMNKVYDGINYINKHIRDYYMPPRNYILQIHGKDKEIWTRVNDKLLTKKEAEKLGEEYKNQGYEIYIS